MTLTVHGSPLSPFVRKVRTVLFEKGLEHAINPVSPFSPPENFREISPLGRIPILQDGDFLLPDSSAICQYIERENPAPSLFPQDNKLYAKALFIEEYADTELAAQIGLGVFRPLLIAPMMGQAPDLETAKKTLTKKLPAHFRYFDTQIGDKDTVLDGEVSIADISLASQIQALAHCGYTMPEADYPNLARHFAAMQARESFAKTVAQEQVMLTALGVKPFDLN